jgi:hypothetical protein
LGERYVVARYAYGGIGDHISCLVGAWYFARRTGRVLVVDWRGSRFSDDPALARNAFERWFAPLGTIEGVRSITDDSVASIDWEGPIWPPKWSIDDLRTSVHVRHSAEELRETSALIGSNDDRPEPIVVFNSWLDPWPPRDAAKRFFAHLRFQPEIEAAAEAFRAQVLGGAESIAIHIRHGNGENIGRRAAYWLSPVALVRQLLRNRAVSMHGGSVWGRFHDNMPESLVGTEGQRGGERAFLRKVAGAVNALRTGQGLDGAKPLLFTDAPHIAGLLRAYLPDLQAFEVPPRESNAGPLHQVVPVEVAGRSDALQSTIVDVETTWQMMLELTVMRSAAGLVYMDSGFSAVVRNELDPARVFVLQPSAVNKLIVKVESRL